MYSYSRSLNEDLWGECSNEKSKFFGYGEMLERIEECEMNCIIRFNILKLWE